MVGGVNRVGVDLPIITVGSILPELSSLSSPPPVIYCASGGFGDVVVVGEVDAGLPTDVSSSVSFDC